MCTKNCSLVRQTLDIVSRGILFIVETLAFSWHIVRDFSCERCLLCVRIMEHLILEARRKVLDELSSVWLREYFNLHRLAQLIHRYSFDRLLIVQLIRLHHGWDRLWLPWRWDNERNFHHVTFSVLIPCVCLNQRSEYEEWLNSFTLVIWRQPSSD